MHPFTQCTTRQGWDDTPRSDAFDSHAPESTDKRRDPFIFDNPLSPWEHDRPPPKEINTKGDVMARKRPIITFKEVTRDGVTFIETTATGHTKASKKNGDDVEWNAVNLTNTDLQVGVIDFYASTGGTPFKNGNVPIPQSLPKNAVAAIALAPIAADGDEATTYKYSVVARVDMSGGVFGPWFLVRDPELEIEPL
jgi:hypothetical protein